MKYEELIILLPCHSIEDFPLHHEGERAEGLLACWTALWHPTLVAAAREMPTWRRADERIDSLANRLILVPEVSEDDLPPGFEKRAEKEGACLIRHETDRAAILATALEKLDDGDRGVDPELAADFLALGYCYLQVELLTRLMRYASSLDEIHFKDQLIDAADAAVQATSDPESVETARESLRACFDTLSEERDHYYPVDAFLLDLTVIAPTTMGASLRRELAGGVPCNLLISAETLGLMARDEPESLVLLRQAIAEERATVIGGDFGEPELPLMSVEQIRANLERGAAEYQRHLENCPQVYGRRRHGLTPVLPQLLKRFGFTGALHATLDDGRFPEGSQARSQWEGLDGSEISAIARIPLDAGRPETFLKLSQTMGEYMDTDHVAVVLLAHWPGKASPWYDDLRRITRYVSALGTMTTFDQLFKETELAGHTDRFKFDQYRTPYLSQDVRDQRRDPISRHVRSTRQQAVAEACQGLKTLEALLAGRASDPVSAPLKELEAAISLPAAEGESQASDEGDDSASAPSWDDRTAAELERTAQALAGLIPKAESESSSGCLVFNPLSYGRRQLIDLPADQGFSTGQKPVVAAARAGDRSQAVVDVPSMGFAWLRAGGAAAKKKRPPKPLAEGNILRNEHMEAWINPVTGTLRSVYDFQSRGNRLSQQLAFRGSGPPREDGKLGSDPEELADYSIMAADAVEITAASPVLGEITTRGRLMSREGKRLATFCQQYRLWRGSRVLWLSIELVPEIEPLSQPWRSYFACRFAWSDSAAEIYRSMHGCRRASKSKRLEASDYIEIEGPKQRTAVLTGGLPYHRRVGLRMLDTLLIVKGETQRQFRLGMGLDMTHPHREALGMHVPPVVLNGVDGPPAVGDATWGFHIDAKNVVATRWEPLLCDGEVVGFRVRLLETAGRKATTRLRSFRQVASARLVDFCGKPLKDCQIDGDAIVMELGGFEWVEVEAKW